MMKKSIIFLLVLTMALSAFLIGCTPKEEDVVTPDPVPGDTVDTPDDTLEEPAGDGPPAVASGEITIGNITEMTGDWLPYFQNIASDYDVYKFITGYSTVGQTYGGEYVISETVVDNLETVDNDDGSKTFIWTIVDGLMYHDGSPITAKDYVASVMLWSSQQIAEMGGQNSYGLRYTGWKEFSSGESKEFTGVRLIDDNTFSVTVSPENVPYFFEMANVSVGPTKLSYWTDDTVDILDDGNGAYFTDNFTTEAYKDKVAEARFGDYPSSGPYAVKSFDKSTATAVLEVNENFLGNYEGQKPKIKTIIYKLINEETAMDEFETGSVDILNAMSSGNEINAGLDLVDKGGFDFTAYPRAGYGRIAFQCDFGPTQFVEVRQAIAHLLDRNDFARTFTGGHGAVVNGPYGEAQWFYQETKAQLEPKLNQYEYGLDKAVAVLEEGGWVLDANGNDYTEGIRHKKLDDGTLMPLVIEWSSSGNEVAEMLTVKLEENPDLTAAGLKINQNVMSFPELASYLNRDGSKDPKYGVPTYHMYNLGTGFTPRYDRSKTYTTDPGELKQGYNDNYIVDVELERLASEMVLLDSEDREQFKAIFMDFVVQWNQLLPDLPLYSNIYHDFYNDKIKDYEINDLVDLTTAILYSYVED